ncbi:auxin response factor 23-like, partial [Cornus florida]|uniref:auxin response factor 23-like n=1 Tax=Cornus florida TaxID=4283 RepID=UPI00289DCAAD
FIVSPFGCVVNAALLWILGQKVDLYSELWHKCAGHLVNVPRAGDRVFYFPQGHMEQVEAYTNQDAQVEMPIYNIPSKILCKVVYVQLKIEAHTDEVFAQITLLPEVKSFVSSPHEVSSPKKGTSLTLAPRKRKSRSFSKRLTPSDTSTHGGFSVPKRNADECFPPLDMSQQPSAQELVAKDLNGFEWHFRHIYRGQPRRHLLTSGWSTFVSAKKLVAGDACIFLRGENGELYVGVRRATKPHNNTSASVISGHSMQHGILASAFHAISTGTMFTVYYRPWTSPSEFIIPYDRCMKLAENNFSVGTRFKMQFEGEEERRCSRFAGTVVGVDDIDCIRWPGSEWRCLKVRWDSTTGIPFRPEQVSPWSIELVEVKKKQHTSTLPHRKRSRPFDPSNPEFPALVSDGLVKKNLVKCTPEIHSGVLQGQEIRATGAYELVASIQPPIPHVIPQSNPDWGHMGLENHLCFQMNGQFYECPGNMVSVPGGNFLNSGLVNYCPPMFTSHGHGSVEVSRSMSVPNINSSSSVSQDWKASEEKKETEAPVALPNGSGRYMLFGVNIFNCHPELPSPQVMSSSELHGASSVPPAASQSSISESVQVSLPSNSISGNLPEKQCKKCSSVTNRSCTKVLKHGTALGRSVDLARFDGYDELICELDQMFDFKGTLIDGSSGWHVTYTDGEGNIMLNGNYPWLKFGSMARKLLICPKEDIDNLEPSSPNPSLL